MVRNAFIIDSQILIPLKFVDAKAVHDSVIEGQKGSFVFESV